MPKVAFVMMTKKTFLIHKEKTVRLVVPGDGSPGIPGDLLNVSRDLIGRRVASCELMAQMDGRVEIAIHLCGESLVLTEVGEDEGTNHET